MYNRFIWKSIWNHRLYEKCLYFSDLTFSPKRLFLTDSYILFDADCRNSKAIGVENNLRNDRMSASSTYKTDYYEYFPSSARLNGPSFWIPASKSNPDDYLQIDFGRFLVVCAVATQGSPGRIANWRVTEYKLSFSSNKSTWQMYQENGKDKVTIS